MRTCYDSVTIADVPAKAEMVACYVDGRYRNEPEARKRFPKATIVTITVTGQAGAHVADCEMGDLDPAAAARWAKAEVKAGRKPTIYCAASQWSTVKRAVGRTKVSWWIADYDGKPVIPAGAVAKQYLGSPGNSPGHYDVSVVVDHWPGVDRPVRRLSVTTRLLARRLVHRLTNRSHPVTHAGDRDLLHELEKQAKRVRAL